MSIEENKESYDNLIQSNPAIKRKGKTIPYTSLNGHMFSFLSKEKEGVMGLRLSENDREEFIKKFNTKIMEQYGRMMKEYVEIPISLLKNKKIMKKYLQMSYDYVASLKPKPTK
jgi:hypothetical protein